jgi:LysM repeat protein
VKQKILACKREIAKPFAVDPGAQAYLREYERIKAENNQLKSQIELWQVYYSNLMARGQAVLTPQSQPSRVENERGSIPSAPQIAKSPSQEYIKYTVKAGDTMSAIAKRNGVSVNTLQSANPGVDSRRLKIGQVLNIPAKQGSTQ